MDQSQAGTVIKILEPSDPVGQKTKSLPTLKIGLSNVLSMALPYGTTFAAVRAFCPEKH